MTQIERIIKKMEVNKLTSINLDIKTLKKIKEDIDTKEDAITTGVSGNFTTTDGKTVTVVDGIIIDITAS